MRPPVNPYNVSLSLSEGTPCVTVTNQHGDDWVEFNRKYENENEAIWAGKALAEYLRVELNDIRGAL